MNLQKNNSSLNFHFLSRGHKLESRKRRCENICKTHSQSRLIANIVVSICVSSKTILILWILDMTLCMVSKNNLWDRGKYAVECRLMCWNEFPTSNDDGWLILEKSNKTQIELYDDFPFVQSSWIELVLDSK